MEMGDLELRCRRWSASHSAKIGLEYQFTSLAVRGEITSAPIHLKDRVLKEFQARFKPL
jgi:hypothetical protein